MNGGLNPSFNNLQNYSDIFTISENLAPNCRSFRRILELIFRAGARHYVQWEDPDNVEWLAEHSLIYQHLHPPQPNCVIRLDFLSADPRATDPTQNKYFGYCSLRPGPKRSVVECAIKPPHDTHNHYLLCQSSWNTRFPVSNTSFMETAIGGVCPFIQQDAVAGVCAHACIRIVTQLLSSNFDNCDAMTVDTIQERTATMPIIEGSHLPSSGLMEYEIFTAIESSGAAPDLYMFEEGRTRRLQLTLEQVAYPYVESGIPVIIGIKTEGQSHGIVIVGHTFDRDSWWQQAELGYYPTLSSGTKWIPSYTWVPEFIVQDDNFGPYLSVSRTLLAQSTRSILVPIPRSCHVFLKGFEAESLVAKYLSDELYEFVLQNTRIEQVWRDLLTSLKGMRNVVLRTLLVTHERLIKHMRNAHLSGDLMRIYQTANFPAYVWVVEVSVPELYSERQKIGEVIINPSYPSSHVQSGVEPLLALRIFDVAVVGTQFASPHVTSDTTPVNIIKRDSFSEA